MLREDLMTALERAGLPVSRKDPTSRLIRRLKSNRENIDWYGVGRGRTWSSQFLVMFNECSDGDSGASEESRRIIDELAFPRWISVTLDVLYDVEAAYGGVLSTLKEGPTEDLMNSVLKKIRRRQTDLMDLYDHEEKRRSLR